MKPARFLFRPAALIALISVSIECSAQSATFKREYAESILEQVADDIAKHYFDPKLRGLDWNSKLVEAKKKIESATSLNAAYANIAAMVDSLDDPHTFFIPPARSFSVDYGWRLQAIGERCLITRVRPQTDAATKIYAGDEVLGINDYKPTRANLHRIGYLFGILRPQSKIELILRSQTGEIRHVETAPKIFQNQLIQPTAGDQRLIAEIEQRRNRLRMVSLSEDVLATRIPTFAFDEDDVGKFVSEARKHKSVIVDLRGSASGPDDSVRTLLGRFFDHDVKIGDTVGRKTTSPLLAKSGGRSFSGKLILLVDSSTQAAPEVFARVIQLEKRGEILGDRTPGVVMSAEVYTHGSVAPFHGSLGEFGVSVTVTNLVMSDGKSLEHVGVTPDEVVLPTAEDLASGRDSVLARAAEMFGVKLSSKEAAQLFPYEWETPISIAGVGSWF